MEKNPKRVLLVVLLSVALVIAFVGGAFASHIFGDVPTGAYYHDDVSWLVANGITAGCGGGKYCPDNAVTRGQMAVFLHKMTDRTRVGHASCPGSTWQPPSSTIAYTTTGGVVQISSGPGGFFRCELVMPDGATMTKVTWSVKDSDAVQDMGCELLREDLVGSIGFAQSIAFAATTGTAGDQALVDTSINQTAVDNGTYAYYLHCTLFQGNDLGIYGGIVEYTYKGLPAP